MKTLKFTLLCYLVAITTTAQNIITIDNSPESTTTHQTLQAALDASAAGDIIYIQPTASNYGSGDIDKPITIVGRSHSEINRVSAVTNIIVRSSDVVIKGIQVSSISTSNTGTIPSPYTGLRVYECKLVSLFLGTSISPNALNYIDDVIIQGSILNNINQLTDSKNVLIGNNIIRGNTSLYAPTTVVISNNIFRAGASDINLTNNSTTATAIFYNNMFKTNSSTDKFINLNSGDFNFSNCLTYNYGGGNLTFNTINGGTYLDNNTLLNTDPLFFDVDSSVNTSFAGSNTNYNPVIRMDNLTLQAGSPALTGGGSGDQIGLFNSGFNYNYIGNPRDTPTIDIINYDAAVPKNGTINVTIKAKAH